MFDIKYLSELGFDKLYLVLIITLKTDSDMYLIHTYMYKILSKDINHFWLQGTFFICIYKCINGALLIISLTLLLFLIQSLRNKYREKKFIFLFVF